MTDKSKTAQEVAKEYGIDEKFAEFIINNSKNGKTLITTGVIAAIFSTVATLGVGFISGFVDLSRDSAMHEYKEASEERAQRYSIITDQMAVELSGGDLNKPIDEQTEKIRITRLKRICFLYETGIIKVPDFIEAESEPVEAKPDLDKTESEPVEVKLDLVKAEKKTYINRLNYFKKTYLKCDKLNNSDGVGGSGGSNGPESSDGSKGLDRPSGLAPSTRNTGSNILGGNGYTAPLPSAPIVEDPANELARIERLLSLTSADTKSVRLAALREIYANYLYNDHLIEKISENLSTGKYSIAGRLNAFYILNRISVARMSEENIDNLHQALTILKNSDELAARGLPQIGEVTEQQMDILENRLPKK